MTIKRVFLDHWKMLFLRTCSSLLVFQYSSVFFPRYARIWQELGNQTAWFQSRPMPIIFLNRSRSWPSSLNRQSRNFSLRLQLFPNSSTRGRRRMLCPGGHQSFWFSGSRVLSRLALRAKRSSLSARCGSDIIQLLLTCGRERGSDNRRLGRPGFIEKHAGPSEAAPGDQLKTKSSKNWILGMREYFRNGERVWPAQLWEAKPGNYLLTRGEISEAERRAPVMSFGLWEVGKSTKTSSWTSSWNNLSTEKLRGIDRLASLFSKSSMKLLIIWAETIEVETFCVNLQLEIIFRRSY